MSWTRSPLPGLAAGHDAVIELSGAVVNQQLRRGQLSFPDIQVGPYNVPIQPAAGPGDSLGSGGTSAALPNQVRFDVVGATSQGGLSVTAGSARAVGAAVVIQMTVENDTPSGRQVVAVPQSGPINLQDGGPVWIAPHAPAPIAMTAANLPPGVHSLTIRVFDPEDMTVVATVQGTLSVTPGTASTVAVATGGGGTRAVGVPGQETRRTRTVSVRATRVGALGVDPQLLLGGTSIVLVAPLTLSVETTEETIVSTSLPGAVDTRTGQLVPITGIADVSVGTREVSADLRVTLPLTVSIDQPTQAFDVAADLTSATVAFTTSDPNVAVAQSELLRQLQNAFRSQAQPAPGTRLTLTPRLSLVGALRPGETVQEMAIADVVARTVAGDSPLALPALAIGVTLAGNATVPMGLTNFLAGSDFAVLISGPVVAAVSAFRWRIGDYPRALPFTSSIPGAYKENATTVEVLIYAQARQSSDRDANGATVASIQASGPRTYGTSTGVYTFAMTDAGATIKSHPEDYLVLGGKGAFEIRSIIRKDNGKDVTDRARAGYAVPTELQSVLLQWPFSLSPVAPQPPLADANLEAFVHALRTGVNAHLSRPFAASHAIQLASRDANGTENFLLSRGNITL